LRTEIVDTVNRIRPHIVAVTVTILAVVATLATGAGATEAGRAAKTAGSRAPRTCDKVASPRGRDAASGTRKRPFASAQRLANALAAGEVGCLRGGSYSASGPYVLDFSRSGVTIMSYPGERALLKGIVVDRSGADGVSLLNVSVDGDGSQNTVQVYGADFTLQGSDLTNSWRGRSCLMLGDATAGTATRPLIRRNRFHECGSTANGNLDHGIYASTVVGGRITENVFWNSAGYAIQLYPNAQNTVFSHNVIDGGGSVARGGLIIGGSTSGIPSSGNTIEYNVIAYASDYNISSWWGGPIGTNNIARNNCLYGGGKGEIRNRGGATYSGNVVASQAFVDRRNYNLRFHGPSGCRGKVG
jgi:hypothetical protein